MISLGPEAGQQYDALVSHYEALERPEAISRLMAAVEAAAARIEQDPQAGLPAPRPYPEVARPGVLWMKEGRYWFAYSSTNSPVILTLFYDQANIPGRLRR